jgi:TIR domain-containing protein
MSLPVHRRPFDAFLSHAHSDSKFVGELYRWLGEIAGFNIWYDAVKMPGGEGIGSGLQAAVEQCRGVVLVGSKTAIEKRWVKEELEIARVELANSPDFRIVPLRLGDADIESILKGHSWISFPSPVLDRDQAVAMLRAFYPSDNVPDPQNSRDVYMSVSWHASDSASWLAVARSLCKAGFRLIGDAKDQLGFKSNRIQSIIESCGAFVGVIPYRDNNPSASATEKPYKYFLTELDIATKANIPTLVIADPRVHRTDGDDRDWLRMNVNAQECPVDVQQAIDDLWNQWIRPPHGHYIFFAADLSLPGMARNSDLREVIERITGMATIVGNDIREPDLQSAIMRCITQSFLVIADISGTSDNTFNLDVSIEAGMALATERNTELLARGIMRSPPFMLRGRQLTPYSNDVEQLGVIHRIVRPYRRRIVNAELSRYTAQG